MSHIWIIMLTMLVAAAVQGSIGFGFGLVAVGLLSMVAPVKDAASMNVLPALMINAMLLWHLRHDLKWRELRWIAIAAACATPIGVLGLRFLNPRHMTGILIVILALTMIQALRKDKKVRAWHPCWLGLPMGSLSGLLAGAYGTGGPPVVAFVHSQNYDRLRHVVSIQFLLAIAGTIRVIALLSQNVLTPRLWMINGLGVIVVLPGVWIGLKLLKRLPKERLRQVTLLMLFYIMIHNIVQVTSH